MERRNRISTWVFVLSDSRARVAFFQRFFAHYQAGLVRELAEDSDNAFHFFGDDRDPMGSGIEPMPATLTDAVQFHSCRTVHVGRKLAFQWRAVREALFSSYDVFIFEGSWTIATNWLAIPLARVRGKRALLYTHGWLQPETELKGRIRDFFYRLSDGLVLYGSRAQAIGVARGFPRERLYVAYNAVDERVSPKPSLTATTGSRGEFRRVWFGDAADRPMIVSVGRLTAAKKYSLLLRAAKLLSDGGTQVNVLLVGDGPERRPLEELARRLDVRLIFAGSHYEEDFLSAALQSANVTVIPGAAGLTVIHSLSHGTPVIVHDEPNEQMPESEAIKDGVNGAFFRNGNAEDLARAIKRSLELFPKTQEVADLCRVAVETAYNPREMRLVFDSAIAGRPSTLCIPLSGGNKPGHLTPFPTEGG